MTKAFARELFAGMGEVRTRRMFGGSSVYCGDVLFALADDDVLWIKVDADNEAAFITEGLELFSYPTKGGDWLTMPYRRLPEGALDDPNEAVQWGRLGMEAALRKKAAAPRKRARKT